MGDENYDSAKAGRIINTLLEHPDGLWLRKLARTANVPTTTLYRYLDGVLSPLIENVGVRDDEGNFFGVRVIRLRKGVRRRLEDGVSWEKVLRTSHVLTQRD